MKILKWISNNLLFVFTLFLLAFIPLYPKIPILDIEHTWVYIRAEDFVAAIVIFFWALLLFRKKISFQTPLTMPILIFWIIGAIATIHGIFLVFPVLSDAFPNVAFLSFLRRIEYLSMFFIAFSSMKDKRFVPYVVMVLIITLLLVSGYGFGQKFLGFPAYLTMNEEFAKGIPIKLSMLSRVPSTFAGHYDLAAYLVLIIPILTSMFFAFKNMLVKAILLITCALGFALLFMTVSRVSLFVLLFSLVLLLLFQRKKLVIFFLFVLTFLFLGLFPSLSQRFGSTVKEADVLISVKTGEAIGHVKDVPSSYFKDKVIKAKFADSKAEIDVGIDPKIATLSAIIVPISLLPPQVPLVVESNSPTGENLPQGTGYINLPLSPVTRKLTAFIYKKASDNDVAESEKIYFIRGDFLVKRALAYDLSFTTRFQGEWPRAIEAFKRNILIGSGYSSVGLAVDNNYLRIMAEVGMLGMLSFLAIFIIVGILIKNLLPDVDSPIARNFILGFVAGVIGLGLNAMLIDVFEASKIAFVLWLLVGITLGILHLYQKRKLNLYGEFIKVVTSKYTIIIFLAFTTVVLYSAFLDYYFVGDDFTWFRWIADCNTGTSSLQNCQSLLSRIFAYFTDANGFFYRPGTKVYFFLMYSGFWLNQTLYHVVSLSLHLIVSVLVFLLARKIIKDGIFSTLAAFLFLILSGYFEAVFWISSTGFLFNAIFSLSALLFFIEWKEKKKIIFFFLSLSSITLSLLFHELGVVVPLLLVIYLYVFDSQFSVKNIFNKTYHLLLFAPLVPYLLLRFFAQSHWFSGDYSYNIFKLPYNIVGNTIGYALLDVFGPLYLPFYQILRNFSKTHLLFGIFVSVISVFIAFVLYRTLDKKMVKEDKKIILFGCLFFTISLLPFLGLGNITSRYSYLSSVGFILLFVFFLKKLYSYLVVINGRYIAIASTVAVICVFCFFQLIQLRKIHEDWHEAGEKSKRFLVSLDKVYTTEPMEFYFVNVPIQHGDAWVFPVGLPDAVWFAFKTKNSSVHIINSVDIAFDQAEKLENGKVLLFLDDGNVKLVKRKKENNVK